MLDVVIAPPFDDEENRDRPVCQGQGVRILRAR